MTAPTAVTGSTKRTSLDRQSRESICAPLPPFSLIRLDLSASPSASTLLSASAPNALYNFRLLEALRSDDPTQVQPFLDELRGGAGAQQEQGQGSGDEDKAGRLLGMAVRVASGE